jgi:dTDP-4-amino-4,6-dideoxygalactose transaminase
MVERRKVPILRVPFSADDKRFITEHIEQVLDSGMLSMGPKTRAFEAGFASLVGTSHCVATSNGTSAIEIILRALEITDSSVIVPTNTFFATALAVLNSGNRVVFVDSDPLTMAIDPMDLRRKIRDDTAAVILVHIGGVVTPAVGEIARICDNNDLDLIEDCAHAHGSGIHGVSAGGIGVAGAFSFFPTKVMTTGEGGTITTDDSDLYERALIIRNQGKVPELGNHIGEIGNNYRLSEITAVLGIEQVNRADRIIAERRHIASLYDKALDTVDGITSLPLPEGSVSGYYKYIAYLSDGIDRASVKKRLQSQYEISLTGEVYADLCHREPVWENYGYCGRLRPEPGAPCPGLPACGCDQVQEGFPGAEYISERHVCLPLYPGLTEDDVAWVAQALDAVLSGRGGGP